MEETGEPRAKLLYLESLRGIAAVVVIFSHFGEAFFPAAVRNPAAPVHSPLDAVFYQTPLGVLLSGNFSVCLFFVMSGFVLVRPFFQSSQYERLASATTRRYFRLMPPVAVSVLAAYLLLTAGAFTNVPVAPTTGSEWLAGLWTFGPNLWEATYQAFVGAFTGGEAPYNPLLWTMQIEFLGSLLIFAVAALMHGRRRRWLVYVGLAVALAHTYYLGFMFGLMMADYAAMPRKGRSQLARLPKPVFVALLALGIILGGYPSSGSAVGTWYGGLALPTFGGHELKAFWHTLGALGVVLAVFYLAPLRKFLSLRWLVRLGRLSFSLYLTHMIILCTFGTFVFAQLRGHYGYLTSFAGSLGLSILVIFGVSALYANYIDGPAIRWAKMVGRWLLAPTVKSTPRSAMTDHFAPLQSEARPGFAKMDPAAADPSRVPGEQRGVQ